MPIQIVFRGKPAANLEIESAWTGTESSTGTVIVGRTDDDGHIVLPLLSAGKWSIRKVHMEECADKDVADWESHWASLTFDLR